MEGQVEADNKVVAEVILALFYLIGWYFFIKLYWNLVVAGYRRVLAF